MCLSGRNIYFVVPGVVLACLNRADVVFMLDSSGSIDRPNFERILDFVAMLVQSFDIDGGQVRVGAVAFADDVQPAFNLNEYSTRQTVQVMCAQSEFFPLFALKGQRLKVKFVSVKPWLPSDVT